jgi:hypothetical protein
MSTSNRVLKAILDGINASAYLEKFEWYNDTNLEKFSTSSSTIIASKFGFPDDLASAFIEGCRNPERYTSPRDNPSRIEVIACTCNRPLYLAQKFPAEEFDSLFKAKTDINAAALEKKSPDDAAKLQQIEDRIHQTWVAGATQALTAQFGGIPATLWPNPESFFESFRNSKNNLVHFNDAIHAALLMEGRHPICRYIAAKHPMQGRQLKKPFQWKCTCGHDGRMFSEILCEYKSLITLQLKVSRCNLRVGMQLFVTSDATRLSFGTFVHVVEQSTPRPENMKFLGEITTINGNESHEISFQEDSEEITVSLSSPLYPKIPYVFVHDGKSAHADLEMRLDEINQRLKAEFFSLHLQEMHAFRDSGEGDFDVSLFDQRVPDGGDLRPFISSTVRDRVKGKWSQFVHFMSFESICDICMRCSSSDLKSRSNNYTVSDINHLFRYMNPLPPEALISGNREHQASNWKENIKQWCQAGATSWPSEIVDIFMFSLQPTEESLSSSAKNAFFYLLSWRHRHRFSLSSEEFKQSSMSQLLQRLPQVEDFLSDFIDFIQILHRQLIFEWLLQLSKQDALSILGSFNKKQSSADKKAVRWLMGGTDQNLGLSRFVSDSAPWTLSVELQNEKEMESFLEYDGEHHFPWNHSVSPHSTPDSSECQTSKGDTNGFARSADSAFVAAAKDGDSAPSSELFICLYFSTYEILRLRARLNASFSQRIRVSHSNSVFIHVPHAQFAPGTSVMVSFNRISGSARSIHSNGCCFLPVSQIHNAEFNVPFDSSNTHQHVPRMFFGDGEPCVMKKAEFESRQFEEIQLVATILHVDVSTGIYAF